MNAIIVIYSIIIKHNFSYFVFFKNQVCLTLKFRTQVDALSNIWRYHCISANSASGSVRGFSQYKLKIRPAVLQTSSLDVNENCSNISAPSGFPCFKWHTFCLNLPQELFCFIATNLRLRIKTWIGKFRFLSKSWRGVLFAGNHVMNKTSKSLENVGRCI